MEARQCASERTCASVTTSTSRLHGSSQQPQHLEPEHYYVRTRPENFVLEYEYLWQTDKHNLDILQESQEWMVTRTIFDPDRHALGRSLAAQGITDTC